MQGDSEYDGTGLETSFNGRCATFRSGRLQSSLQHVRRCMCDIVQILPASKALLPCRQWPQSITCNRRFRMTLHKKGAMPSFVPEPFETPILENKKEVRPGFSPVAAHFFCRNCHCVTIRVHLPF